jgi:hypothetical protein
MEEVDKKTLESLKAEMLKGNISAQQMLAELAKRKAELDKKVEGLECRLCKLKERK